MGKVVKRCALATASGDYKLFELSKSHSAMISYVMPFTSRKFTDAQSCEDAYLYYLATRAEKSKVFFTNEEDTPQKMGSAVTIWYINDIDMYLILPTNPTTDEIYDALMQKRDSIIIT